MPSLGLAMIVRNGAKALPPCLASVAGLAARVVIADTGSSDGTAEVARQLGAEVFDFPWRDDFSLARNAAIEKLATDWVLVLDDDEELDRAARGKLASLLDNPRVGGYRLVQRNYLPVRFGKGGHASTVMPLHAPVPRAERARAYNDIQVCRLFRRHPGIAYTGKVHEFVESSIRDLGLGIIGEDLIIHHFGHLSSPAALRSKDDLYRKLGRLKVQDTPADPQAWIELGLQEYEQFQNYSAGIECFKTALALGPRYSFIPYLSLASLYIEIQADAEALKLLSNVTLRDRAAGESAYLCGVALYNLGRLKESRTAYLRALKILPGDARIISKLGLTEVRLGLKKSGLTRLAAGLKADREDLEMHQRMIQGFVLAEMPSRAAEAAEHLAWHLPSPATILRAASLRAVTNDWQAVEIILDQGLKLFPGDRQLLQARTEAKERMHYIAAHQPLRCSP